MAKTLSTTFKRRVNAVSAPETPVIALEITHADLATPIRVIGDTQDLEISGDTFVAMPFRIQLPDDLEKQQPRARLAIDNVGRGPDGNSLADWLERSAGGRGARVRIMLLLRSDPDTIEWEATMDLANVQATLTEVRGELQYEDLLNRQAIAITYRPDTAPGLF